MGMPNGFLLGSDGNTKRFTVGFSWECRTVYCWVHMGIPNSLLLGSDGNTKQFTVGYNREIFHFSPPIHVLDIYPHQRRGYDCVWVRLFASVWLFVHTELSCFSPQPLVRLRRNFHQRCDDSCRMFYS